MLWGTAMTKKILVVEDELGNLNLVSHLLNQAGYEVSGAKDGLEAMELLGHSRFDLVLSDLRMPGMDGLTLASHIVSSDPTTPVLLMTAHYFDNRADISELGVRCLRKPFSPNELLSEIEKVIGEEQAEF
jgi:CheY-like chemotaxis protein